MSRQDAKPGAGIGGEQESSGISPGLSDQERVVLDVLVACKAGRTIAQLSGTCGLDRQQVESALADLRAKGLVTRFNTVVESYAARFPGVDV